MTERAEKTESSIEELSPPTVPPPPRSPLTDERILELVALALAPLRDQIGDIHSLLLGAANRPGLGKALHDVNNNLAVVKANTEHLVDTHAGYANEVQRIYVGQEHLRHRMQRAEAEIELLKHPEGEEPA